MQKKVKKLDLKKIKSEIEDLKKSLLNLKFQKATGQLEKTSELKKIRRKIASLKTILLIKQEKLMSKRILSGTVISSNANKTVVVKVTRRVQHKLYKKIISRTKKYHAHDENNTYKIGDNVNIRESRPISKLKSWVVINNSLKENK